MVKIRAQIANFDSSFPPGGTATLELGWPKLWHQVLPHQRNTGGMVETWKPRPVSSGSKQRASLSEEPRSTMHLRAAGGLRASWLSMSPCARPVLTPALSYLLVSASVSFART